MQTILTKQYTNALSGMLAFGRVLEQQMRFHSALGKAVLEAHPFFILQAAPALGDAGRVTTPAPKPKPATKPKPAAKKAAPTPKPEATPAPAKPKARPPAKAKSKPAPAKAAKTPEARPDTPPARKRPRAPSKPPAMPGTGTAKKDG